MKAAVFVFLLAVSGAVMRPQTSAPPSGDVTIKMSEGAPEYCVGLSNGGNGGPDDITLRLRVRLRYENHRSETIFLPLGYNFLWRMTVAGQNGSTILRRGGGGAHGLDVKSLMTLSRPEAGPFWTVPGGK